MSFFRLPKLQRLASTMGTIRSRLGRKPGKSITERANRRLLIDTLEERQLLTVAPGYGDAIHVVPEHVDQMLVNEIYSESQSTVAGKSLASDNDGDFVVAWTRIDEVLDQAGNPVIDPATGFAMTDANIYARYFTDEVQRIVLPKGVLDDALVGQYATFSLDYNGNEVQKISITATNAPAWVPEDLVTGDIVIGFDADFSGVVDAGEFVTFAYDEANMVGSAAALETELQGLGGYAAGIKVSAMSPGELIVEVDAAFSGMDFIDMEVDNANTVYGAGFYPATVVTPYRDPGVMANIPVSPDDPNMTAYAIEQYFAQLTSVDTEVGPVYFYASPPGPYVSTMTLRTPLPDIQVTSVRTADDPEGLRTFDITFVGNSGKINHPQMEVIDVKDEWSNALADGTVTTTKETSSEFRVNAEEPDDPFTPLPDKFDQTHAVVAMDADGDFIITWQSKMPDTPANRGSESDIFARRFSPTGFDTIAKFTADDSYLADTEYPTLVKGTDGEYTSVRAVAEFQVNEFTTGAQAEPDVGMDEEGNFVIVWDSEGQQVSFFNGVIAQRFDRHGDRMGGEFLVNNFNTNEHVEPAVALSNDGHFIITWTETRPGFTNMLAEVYSPQGDVLLPQFSINPPGNAGHETTADWDADNNFAVAWHHTTIGQVSGVRAKLYELYDDNGAISGAVLQDQFRANSATTGDVEDVPAWLQDQSGPSAGLDADGDLVITFDGYGPDVADTSLNAMDIDTYINLMLVEMYNTLTAIDPPMDPDDISEQIGLLRAVLETNATIDMLPQELIDMLPDSFVEAELNLLRGDANAVMFTRWDADENDPWNILNSDSIINAKRDGRNSRHYIAIEQAVTAGGYTLNVSGEEVRVDLDYVDNVLQEEPSRAAIEEALRNAAVTGTYWPWDVFQGPVDVRIITDAELLTRTGTDWELPQDFVTNDYFVVEVVFQGSDHDTFFSVTLVDHDLQIEGDPADPPEIGSMMYGDPETPQHDSSMEIEPDGDFVTAWTQDEIYSDTFQANQNIYYREFDERTDTAGPRMVDLYDSLGNGIGFEEYLEGNSRYIVLTFDEEMLAVDPSVNTDSILNPENFVLYEDGEKLPFAVSHVDFGMSRASELAGTVEPAVVRPSGKNNDFVVTANSVDPAFDDVTIEFINGGAIGNNAVVTYNAAEKMLTIAIDLSTTTGATIVAAINAEGTFVANLTNDAANLVDNEPTDNDGSGTVNDLGEMATIFYYKELSSLPSNKWEAVLVLDVEGGLPNGEYTITARTPILDDPGTTDVYEGRPGLRDAVLNPLAYTGHEPDGLDMSRTFQVLSSSVSDIRVNADITNDQDFLDTTMPPEIFPNSPRSVADDADGDYVVVWTNTNPATGETLGISAKLYNALWQESVGGGRSGDYTIVDEIEVTDLADTHFDASTATYASVARDGDGDFIVTWSAQSLDGDGSWDVWYRRYDALGNELGAANEVSTLSLIDFEEGMKADFTLGWGADSAVINYDGTTATAWDDLKAAIQTQLNAWTADATVGDVDSTDSSTQQLAITFNNPGDQDDITVSGVTIVSGGGSVTTNILARTTTQGSADGVFRANSVTELDQRFSTVAMDIDGDFVITWQSEGQDGNGSEIYAKRFDRYGNVLGAENETQVLSFEDNPTGKFKIYWDGNDLFPNESGEIDYDGNADPNDAIQLTSDVKAAMLALGAEVRVQWLNSTDLQITFIGESGRRDVPEIQIDPVAISGGADAEIVPDTALDGATGEFRINETTEDDQRFASVAMDALGDFVVSWTSDGQDGDDADESNIYARLYDSSGTPSSGEFLVNVATDHIQKWSSVAMDADGDFAVTWTSYGEPSDSSAPEADGDGLQDVMARRYNSDGTPVAGEFQVNSFTTGTQQHSQIAMDADGDFVITWESFQDRPGPGSDHPNVPENYGVYIQAYAGNGSVGLPQFGPNGEIDDEERINFTVANDQRYPGVALDDTGDCVIVWSGYGMRFDPLIGDMVVDDDQGIYSRRFPKKEDIAGPTVTDVLNSTSGRDPVPNGSELDQDVTQFIVIFGENLDTEYGEDGAHGISNPDNWQLRRDGEIVTGGVASVTFPGNKVDGKYEATVAFDGDPTLPGNQPLEDGLYTLTVFDEVEDIWGNALDGDYDGSPGDDFMHAFRIRSGGGGDTPVGDHLANARTYAETPGAVAVDGDGDHIVTWTAHDETTGLDRVYFQVFNSDGSPRTGPFEITPSADSAGVTATATDLEFIGDDQRYANVACDEDGDFVISWTNFRNGEQDIYARRFNTRDGWGKWDDWVEQDEQNNQDDEEAFRVNTYTKDNQKYSSVAMDLDGDFVVAWSSYSQEDNGQLGKGYGVYARRYDNFGQPLAPEFPVNITTAGNQMLPSVAMDLSGQFVVAWQSDQNGIGDDIVARVFDADSTPWGGPWGGELLVNDTTDGNQRYPDVAMSETGQFVVTWTATEGVGDDFEGTAVYAQRFNMGLLAEFYDQNIPMVNLYESEDVGQTIAYDLGSVISTIDIAHTYTIVDINVEIDITHPEPEELVIFLRSPNGTIIELCREVPTSGAAGQDFQGTDFDDERDADPAIPYISIQANSPLVTPPFSNRYIPAEPLSTFDLQNVGGTWELIVQDNVPVRIITDTAVIEDSTTGTLNAWSLEITRITPRSGEFQVNTTTEGDQIYSSIAMNRLGAYTITWSGYGNQEDQEDESGYGVFYQSYVGDEKVGGETRVNSQIVGNQWMSSIGSDAEGNFVIVWTGLGRDADGRVDASTTGVYKYLSSRNVITIDGVGPLVTGITDSSGNTIMQGGVLATTTNSMSVQFDEEMSKDQVVVDGDRSPAMNSVLNLGNWTLERNGTEIIGAISGVEFSLNGTTNKYEAGLTLDGNGMDPESPALEPGSYTLTLSDLVTDVEGNKLTNLARLSGDRENQPGVPPFSQGLGGLVFEFYISEDTGRLGAEFRINDDEHVSNQQRLGTTLGIGQAEQESTMAVAVDHDGDFAVVWTSYGQDDPTDPQGAGVYLRLYSGQSDQPIADTPEILVNEGQTVGHQRNASVAMDADGDIIVAWEARGDDGTWDVWARRFDAAGNPIVSDTNLDKRIDWRDNDLPFQVNTFEANDQLNPAVATDDYGNFVIVWATKGQTLSYFNDVHAQMFNYMGEQVGEEFQVNQESIPGVSMTSGVSMINPAVARSGDGSQFVVAWEQNIAQSNGVVTDSNIVGRLFNSFGQPLVLSANEFQVNAGGDFTSDPPHDPHVGPGGDDSWQRAARNPQITMGDTGNFVVVWESYEDNDTEVRAGADSYGIYFRGFDATGTPLTGGDQQANLVVTEPDQADTVDIPRSSYAFEGDQLNPSIAMDADGDFAIVWDGNGAEPHPLDQIDPDLISDRDDAGVFLRQFNPAAESVSVQQRVNRTTAGIQEFPTIGMTRDGDMIVVWSGNGVGDRHGIFARSYQSQTDTAGPMATELRWEDGPGNYRLVGEGDNIVTWGDGLHKLYVVFDEEMNREFEDGSPGEYSVENVNNWAIVNGRDQEIQGAIASVDFVYNATLQKWTAEINLSAAAGLANGDYTLIARSDMQDVAGNSLGRSGLRPNGLREDLDGTAASLPITNPTGGFGFVFRMNDTLPGDAPYGDIDQNVSWASIDSTTGMVNYQEDSAVSRNSKGDYVVVWVNYDETGGSVVEADILAQRFDREGRAIGGLILVNSLTTGMQIEPDVALDDAGNFVVVWSGDGAVIGDESGSGIFAQRFDDEAKPVGGQFLVNQYTQDDQDQPSVAMNENNGDFVIAWTSFKRDAGRDDVMARKYAWTGQALTDEFLVNSYTAHAQSTPDVAMNTSGNFVITWGSDDQDADSWGVYGQRYSAAANRLGGEFRVNTQQNDDQQDPAIAMDNGGNFVITWESYRQDGSGWGVYAQRYNNGGAMQGGEFRVNQTTQYFQQDPDVALDDENGFVITWTSFDQDNPQDQFIHDNGIYARMYNSDGSGYVDTRVQPGPIGEFRVNGWTDGDQYQSAVSMDGDGHYVVTWTGQFVVLGTRDIPAIFSRIFDPPAEQTEESTALQSVHLVGTSGDDLFEFIGGPSSSSWLVKINGNIIDIGANVGTITFAGGSGNDTVIIVGSHADDSAELWDGHAVLSSDDYTLSVENVESIRIDGGGGNDTAAMHDSDGDDLFTFMPAYSTITGTGLDLRVDAFEHVTAYAGSGRDVAKLNGSTGDDTFSAYPTYAVMETAGMHGEARGFELHRGYAVEGGTDNADLYDGPGDDWFNSTPTFAKLYGEGFYSSASNFDRVVAIADGSGSDVAIMKDSAGDDTFEAGPGYGKLYDEGVFYTRADGFEFIMAYGDAGGNDTARLYDSTGDDIFVAGPGFGKMTGAGFSVQVDSFQHVTGYGNAGGTDRAELFDSGGDDNFVATTAYGALYGEGFYNRAYSFEAVDARSTGGGNDTALLYDSAMNDYLTADEEERTVTLISAEANIRYWVSHFDFVEARSTNEGDTKSKESALVDFLLATGQWEEE